MPCYDRISGSLKKVKTIYDRISGSLKEVKTGYDRISGSLKVYHESGLRLGDLPLGSKIEHNGIYYTLIAHDGFVTGDSVLWVIYGNYSNYRNNTTTTTPFGTANTNEVTINYQKTTGGSKSSSTVTIESATGYGVLLPMTTLGLESYVRSGESPSRFTYFNNASRRIRYSDGDNCGSYGTAYQYKTPSMNRSWDSEEKRYSTTTHWISSSGNNIDYDGGAICMNNIYAYSVHADLRCTENSDGTYTLNI